MAFDFDGTLAPLVDDPLKACVPQSWRGMLRELALHRPLAVISGRCVYQLKTLLQLPGCLLAGNHGAQQDLSQGFGIHASDASRRWIDALNPYRDQIALQKNIWLEQGVVIEDKGCSIAIHYRTAKDKLSVQALLEPHVQRWVQEPTSLGPARLRVWHGHDVINLISAEAPDKGDALLTINKDLGLSTALFVGDDSNDEPAFEKALPGSVTVKIGGNTAPSAAAYFLNAQGEVGMLLHYLCRHLPDPAARHQAIASFSATVGPADHTLI